MILRLEGNKAIVARWSKTGEPITKEEWDKLPKWQRVIGHIAAFILAFRYGINVR